ncbi:flagellar filament capping protein FliD [Thiomicrorhabdus cannonii]|uniref:flagellar filament capping protein FliD n=1 Tax=Thiomicrorhabdus cannonii TaxID=2748011 RepID=UPI0015BD754D|nr:flagellar filament capping protein FliD [Thiomicrorhabdus cannonii]
MANEIGNTLLNSLTKSTFDIGNMSKALAEAEVAGPKAILERNQTKTTTELDALKYLQTNLSAFNTYVADLSSPDLFGQKGIASTNDGIVTVTAENEAALGAYQIVSKQLAQAHTLVANKGFASPSDTLSAGTLSISVSGQTHVIPVDGTNNTLEGLQKLINNGDYGVNAAIINNGGSYQLMFTSKQTGAAGEIAISGLPDFDTSGFTTTAEAQDAVMVLNGLTVTSANNTFDQVIEGVAFELKSAAPSSPTTVSVTQDSAKVKETITSFVDVYNQMNTILDELGSYDKSDLTEEELASEEYLYYGDLAGNSLLRSIRSQMRESLTGVIDGLGSSSFQSLADVGVSFDRNGELSVDTTKLDAVLANNMQAVSSLFAMSGSSDDALVNVVGGNDKTQTGNYALNITQLAERASVTAGSVTGLTADERVAGDRVTDAQAVLTIEAGASFDLDIAGVNHTIDLSGAAGVYADKNAVTQAIQAAISAQFTASEATIAYDSTQSRFEITAASGSASMSNIVGLGNQGFSQTDYTGQALLDIGAGAGFNVKVNDADTTSVSIAEGRYTLDELTQVMANNINNNSDVSTAGASVSVTHDGSVISIASTRFGGLSMVELTNIAGLSGAGFADGATLSDQGQSVDGTLSTPSGDISIGVYADAQDGRKIKISDFAPQLEARGLEFEILGGATGARGTITYSQGFASQLQDSINNLLEADTGLVGQRINTLNDKMDSYEEKSKAIDARYEKLLMKYQLQFSVLQSLMSSSEQTRSFLTATFSNNNNN